MNKYNLIFISGIIVTLTLSGCSSDPELSMNIPDTQVYQMGDAQLTCGDLQQAISQTQNYIRIIGKQISDANNNSALASFESSLGSFSGTATPMAGLASSEAQMDASSLQGKKRNYQQRYNILVKQFYAKKCSA